MKYFKAVEVAYKPFVRWNLVADSFEKLEDLGLDSDPLVLAEADVPEYIFGVSPKHIVAGVLVDFTESEMDVFEVEFLAKETTNDQGNQLRDVNAGTFVYDGETFPMNQTARLYYLSFQFVPSNVKVLQTDGDLYSLLEENIPDFCDAFYTKLKDLTKPITP